MSDNTHATTPTPVINLPKALVFIIINITSYAFVNLFVKMFASADYSVAQIVLMRGGGGFFFIALIVLMAKNPMQYIITDQVMLNVIRAGLGIAATALAFWSIALQPIANATVQHFTSVIFAAALSIPLLQEKVGPVRWSAIILGFIGIIFILQPEGGSTLFASFIGLLAAMGIAATSLIIRQLGVFQHPLTTVFYYCLISLIIPLPFAVYQWTPVVGADIILFLLLAACGTLGQYTYARALQLSPVGFVGPFIYLNIFYALTFDFWVWGVAPSPVMLGGAVIIIASGLIIIYREAQIAREHHRKPAEVDGL